MPHPIHDVLRPKIGFDLDEPHGHRPFASPVISGRSSLLPERLGRSSACSLPRVGRHDPAGSSGTAGTTRCPVSRSASASGPGGTSLPLAALGPAGPRLQLTLEAKEAILAAARDRHQRLPDLLVRAPL